jgi:hypothetical protein
MNYIALRIYLQMFLVSLPVLIVCLVACLVILARWRRGLLWALSGFGLGLLISLATPITQACVQSWVMRSENAANYAWIFAVLGLFWSVLHACAYALLFVAVFEGRK